jgi:hypothetical protein
MIDLKAVAAELAQARQARIAAQLAGCEVEELAEGLRQASPAWRRDWRRPPERPADGVPLFVFAP